MELRANRVVGRIYRQLSHVISTSPFFVTVSVVGCAGNQLDALPSRAKPLEHVPVPGEPDVGAEQSPNRSDVPRPWASHSYSPRPGSTPEPELVNLADACGVGDVALHEVARLVAELHQEDQEVPGLDAVRFHLRRRGAPYVMPRLWSATMKGVVEEELVDNVSEWAHSGEKSGNVRCGVGVATAEDGFRTVSVLQVEVHAELQPIATQVQPGEWIDLEARMLVPTTSATVLLLPPEGRPRRLNTKLEGGTAKARFSVETPGTWLVQLMATQKGGPRPVAGILISAGNKPPQGIDTSPVPGESAWDKQLRPPDALFELMNAAREDQGLPPLKRNRSLDRVAQAHSQAMMDRGRISHDTGAGDPARRVEMAGMSPKATGENVALAGSVVRLHRVLWASPSHRENLLLRRWDEVGVAISRREDGTLFATQLFGDLN